MASSIKQNQQDYERAKTAYITGNYEQAAEIIEKLAQNSPNDPEILLLRGHIYCYFQDFESAREQYNLVIQNTESEEFIECANSGLETVEQWEKGSMGNFDSASATQNVTQDPATAITDQASWQDDVTGILSEEENWQFEADPNEATGALNSDLDANPFTDAADVTGIEEEDDNPFGELSEDEMTAVSALNDDFEEEDDEEVTNLADTNSLYSEGLESEQAPDPTGINDDSQGASSDNLDNKGTLLFRAPDDTPEDSEADDTDRNLIEEEFDFSQYTNEDFLEEEEQLEGDDNFNTFGHAAEQLPEQFSTAEQTQSNTSRPASGSVASGQTGASDPIQGTPTPAAQEANATLNEEMSETGQGLFASSSDQGEGLFSNNGPPSADLAFETNPQGSDPVVEQEQGTLAFLENASLAKKQQLVSGAVGVASAVVVAISSFVGSTVLSENKPGFVNNLVRSSAIGLVGGAASAGVTWALGGVVVKQIKRSTGDLQAQLYAVQQGNLEAKATVYSQDEFGQLASGFNQMTRVVSTTTNEAQRKAQEQEQAKEDLQRQVIRLLDDVEGAARGDLTVQAQVSADVLGAVADAFNLTIRSLRTIVQQVKDAAREVNEGAAESASFAGGLSEDALRQAEELAVSLNSAQMMTDSIQRVADNAKEAEAVARTASETALKGGEAVDSTVAGILQIRETVAQSTRKVKRLAESSQEISKIVSVISQIATRTNNLALNASIEAARAGEAGRGFAVIADEVRQLADRSTKSLREIEKIVLQIQSETSSVMIAMEEGTQQVIEGTERAEQAKNSLEDIIQVSNRIDSLVQSITADTVEQSETAQSVAQVMQSVEMTAQGTSQESQQVSTALQNLVSLAGDLLASVERFRVNPEDQQNN